MSTAMLDTRPKQTDVSKIPIAALDCSDPALFQNDTLWPVFERLRREDPVHFFENEQYGRFWSVTKYKDIMAVDTNHHVYSSEASLGGITIRDPEEELRLPMFIAMDPPKHDEQRKVVSPIVAPENLAKLEAPFAPACKDFRLAAAQ